MIKKLMMMFVAAMAAVCAHAVDGIYGPYVPGAAVDVDLGLVGYTAKKLPSGLKLDKKTGIVKGKAKKPGEYEVTFTKKGAETLTAKFIVGPMPTITITMQGDSEKCKVTGASKPGKGYLVGKKVSLSAKGTKGTAFTGWFKDGEPWPNATEYLESKLKHVMTEENLSLVARFEKEKMLVSCDGLSALAVGEEVALPIAIKTQSGVKSVTGSKLPSGLKVKKDKATGEWFVTGKPKKVGTWNTTIKVTAKSGAVEQLPISMTVTEAYIPEGNLTAANGYFRESLKNGKGEKYALSVGITNGDDFLPSLQLNKGKLAVSGLPSGLKYDVKTGKITGVATKEGDYTVTLTVTDGKAKYVSTITIEVEPLPAWIVGTFRGGVKTSGSGWSDACGFEVKVTPQGSISAKLIEANPAWGSVKLKTSGLVKGDYEYSFVIRDGDFEDGEEGSIGEVFIFPLDYGIGCLYAEEVGIDEDGDEFKAHWDGYQDIYSLASSVIPKPVFKTDDNLFLNIDQKGELGLIFGAKGEVTVSEPGAIWSNAQLLPWNYDFENNVVGASLWVMGYNYFVDCTFGAELYIDIPVAQDGTAKVSEISIRSVYPGPNW
jgi:hypothetical protein